MQVWSWLVLLECKLCVSRRWWCQCHITSKRPCVKVLFATSWSHTLDSNWRLFPKKLKLLPLLAQQDTILLMRKSWMMSTVSFNSISFCYWTLLHLCSLYLLQSPVTFSNNVHKILLTFWSKFHWTFVWHSGRAQAYFIFTPCFSERQRSTL